MNEVKKCPKCSGDLEEGSLNAGFDALYWIARTYSEELLAHFAWRTRLLKAWRCKKCQLVVFTYEKRTLMHQASERWLE